MNKRIVTIIATALFVISGLLTSTAASQAAPATQQAVAQTTQAQQAVAAGTNYISWSCSYHYGKTSIKVSAWNNSNGTRTYHFGMRENDTSSVTSSSSESLWVKMNSSSGSTFKTFDRRWDSTHYKEWYWTKSNTYLSYVLAVWRKSLYTYWNRWYCPKTAGSIGYRM